MQFPESKPMAPSSVLPTKLHRSLSLSSSSSCIQSLLKRGFTPTTNSTTHLLVFLAKSHRYKFLTYFFHQLTHNRVKPSSQSRSIFTWALLKLGELDEAERLMRTHSGNSPAHFWDALIRGYCLDNRDPGKGFLVLQDCLRNYGITPSSRTFTCLVRSFSSVGKMGEAIEVVELMNNGNVRYPFGNFVTSSVISGFCEIGRPELGLEFFEKAVGVGALRPNVVTYTVVVSALCMLGRVEEVSELVRRMEKERLELDVVFYSCWIYGYLREGMVMEAFLRCKEMFDKGLKMDSICYSILIDGFSKDGRVEKTVGLLNKMVESGLEANLITYTAIILGFCRKGKMDDAFALFKKVEELGMEMDEFIYAVLIDGVCKTGDISNAYRLLDEMEKKGISPSIVTFNTLIHGLSKLGRTRDGDEVSKVIVGDAVTYTTLLHGFIEEGDGQKIVDVKQRLQESEVHMDIVMCNVLLRALFMVGAFEDASTLYNRMHELDLVPDSVTFCTMINGFCKVRKITEALQVFDESRKISVPSSACYSCVINGLCHNSMVDVASEIFIELTAKGLSLDIRNYEILINGILEANGTEGVVNLICRIHKGKMDRSGAIINSTIRLLCQKNFPIPASELLVMAKTNQLVLTTASYYLTLKGLLSEGSSWLSLSFMSSFVKEYGLLEPRVSKILLHYLCMKDLKKACFLFNKLKANNPKFSFPVKVLRTLVRTGRAVEAYDLFKRYEDEISATGLISFSILVDGLCKEGHLIEALELCAIAERNNLMLNIVTYNSVKNGLCLQGCLLEACRLFDSLEKMNLNPSEITYGTLIDTLCRGGYLLDAKQYLETMSVKGHEPNTHIFNSLISGYCKFGRMEDAFQTVKMMEMKCIVPDEYTVSALIDGYCRRGDVDEARQFFFDYKTRNTYPDFLGFLSLIKGLCNKGRMDEAHGILREMLLRQPIIELINKVKFNVGSDTVGNFLVSLCEQGTLESFRKAVSVLDALASALFPAKRPALRNELRALNKLSEFGELSAGSEKGRCKLDRAISSAPSQKGMSKAKMGHSSCHMNKGSTYHLIDSYYTQAAALCSKGELLEANKLVQQMLASLDRHS